MTIDLRTAVLIRRRLAALPVLLHHEARTPAARFARIGRIDRWLGLNLWLVASYLSRNAELPAAGKHPLKRWAASRQSGERARA